MKELKTIEYIIGDNYSIDTIEVKDNEIKPELRLYVTKDKRELRLNIGHYLDDNNIVKYNNFISILDDLIHDNAYFVKEELK